MKGHITNIEQNTLENEDYRRVLYTAKNMQLVLMSLKPGEEVGEEVHNVDQFVRIEQGDAVVILDGEKHAMEKDFSVIIPAGTKHNVINSGGTDLKLYALYAPPEHKDGVVDKAKEDEKEEHFDGETTEA